MTNKMYDNLKFIAQIVLPALGTLYFALAGIWGFPYGEQIVGTIAAIDAFLGAILQISSTNYYKNEKDIDGTLVIDAKNGEVENWSFEMGPEMSLEDLAEKKAVKLVVNTPEEYQAKH